jgi:hypothetical protein
MPGTCPYKDLFGKPGTGVHRWRVANIAVVDVLATVILAAVVSSLLRVSFLWTLVILFIIGELLHYWMCVDTTVIKWFKDLGSL